jgi:hypothetical protein
VTQFWNVPSDRDRAEALNSGRMPEQHPNAVFRGAEEARSRDTFAPEDIVDIEPFLRKDVRWNSPWGAGRESRKEVMAQYATFNEATGGTMQMTITEVFADERQAVSLVRLEVDRPERPGRHIDVKEANVFHLDEKGRAYEFCGVAENQAEINSFSS